MSLGLCLEKAYIASQRNALPIQSQHDVYREIGGRGITTALDQVEGSLLLEIHDEYVRASSKLIALHGAKASEDVKDTSTYLRRFLRTISRLHANLISE